MLAMRPGEQLLDVDVGNAREAKILAAMSVMRAMKRLEPIQEVGIQEQ
jgi:hypothetical protein